MRKLQDLTGQHFGRLTVIKRVENNKYGHVCWLCECSCKDKTQLIVSSNSLKQKKCCSCGCYRREQTIKNNKISKRKFNTYDLTGNYGIGYTSQNDKFYFDIEDYDKIKKYYWRKHYKGYIYTEINDKYTSLHRYIMKPSINKVVDHINRSKFDNRKDNLKICSQQNNMHNQGLRKNNNSGIVGVTWDKSKNKWHSYININGKLQHIGFFVDKKEAIIARLKAEKDHGYSGVNQRLWNKYNII